MLSCCHTTDTASSTLWVSLSFFLTVTESLLELLLNAQKGIGLSMLECTEYLVYIRVVLQNNLANDPPL